MKHYSFCFLFLTLVNLFYYASNAIASPIINGIPDDHHQFKFHISIHRKSGPTNEYKYVCGGSIISEKYILTAAHCFITKIDNVIKDIFYPSGKTKIIAGTNQRNGPGIERDLIRAFIPLEYNADRNYQHRRLVVEADIAVAELNADLNVHQHADRLSIIPLEALDPHSNVGVNEQATFCGFGLDLLVQGNDGQLHPRSGNNINKYMSVNILGREQCTIFNTAICAMNANERVFRTACYGDSGAGLVYNNKIVGVLSTVPRLCNKKEMIKFTRLYDYMRFIEEAQNPRGDHRIMITLDETLKSPMKEYRNPNRPHDGSSSSSLGSKRRPS